MDELQLIFIQRKSDQSLLPPQNRQSTHKSSFLQREKQRIQRENWIFKLLKSIRTYTLENKKNIYKITQRMMNQYRDMPEIQIEYQKIFTQAYINLFVQFFRDDQQGISLIKVVIRPNNQYIVPELLKIFIDFSRTRFKKAIAMHFNQVQEVKKSYSLQHIPSNKSSDQTNNKNQNPQKQKTDFVHSKIAQSLNQKYNRFINIFQGRFMQSKCNQTYIDLLSINSTNANMVKKYYDKCYGNKKNISYNYSNLYTKKQIQVMQLKINQEIQKNKQLVKNIPKISQASDIQLKNYIKLKIQVQQNENKLKKSKKSRNPDINDWLSLSLIRTEGQFMPIQLMANINQQQSVHFSKFTETYGMHIKNYLRQMLVYKINRENPKIYQKVNQNQRGIKNALEKLQLQHSSSLALMPKKIDKQSDNHYYNDQHKTNPNKRFRKDLFLDSYGQKIKQLLCKPPLYYIKDTQSSAQKIKTQRILPSINLSQSPEKPRGHIRSQSNFFSGQDMEMRQYRQKYNASFIRMSKNVQDQQDSLQALKRRAKLLK